MTITSWFFSEPGHNAKVAEIQGMVLVKKNIGGFEITMQKTQRMQVCYCACELLKEDADFIQREQASVEQVFLSSTSHIGHHQVMIASRLAGIKTRNTMLMLEGLYDLSFTMHHVQVDTSTVNDFDRYVCFRDEMLSQVDSGHASLRSVLAQPVGTDTSFELQCLLRIFKNGLHLTQTFSLSPGILL